MRRPVQGRLKILIGSEFIRSFEMIEKEYEDLPEEYDIETLHICNCNCKCCDYCSICRGQIVWEIIG